jgi:hypothetical protein
VFFPLRRHGRQRHHHRVFGLHFLNRAARVVTAEPQQGVADSTRPCLERAERLGALCA